MELVIKCLLIKQNWRLDGFTAKLHQRCDKNLHKCSSIFFINYKRKEGKDELTHSAQQHCPDTDLDKNTVTKRKLLANLPEEYRWKNSQ